MNFYLTAQHTSGIIRIVMKRNTQTGAGETAARMVTLPLDVVRRLVSESQDLLDFAEAYGVSERAHYVDWMGYFDETQKAIDATKSAIRQTKKAA